MITPTSSATAAPPPAATGSTASSISSDFDTFLQMLTAQMRNQDPLDPANAEDFAVQLATFSQLEQQVLTNNLLSQLVSPGTTSEMHAAGMIGKQVLSTAAVQLGTDPITIRPGEAPGQTRQLAVIGPDGERVQTLTLRDTQAEITWPAAGASATPGAYRFVIETMEDGTVAQREDAPAFGLITEVHFSDSGPTYRLASGAEIGADDILALRNG